MKNNKINKTNDLYNTNGNVNNRSEKYRPLFTQEFLMGPNSMRLLEEMLDKYPLKEGSTVMDLGCGKGLTSLFLTKEAKAKVYATDLWISATENARQFEKWGILDTAVPIHADANDLPYAEEYFDAIVTIDSFHYFANQKGFFQDKIVPLLKKDGVAIIAMPGLKEEMHGKETELLLEWVNGEVSEYESFHSRKWWIDFLGESEDFEVIMDFDLDCCNQAWEDWFASNHPFAKRDGEYFEKGIDAYLSFVGLVIRRRDA